MNVENEVELDQYVCLCLILFNNLWMMNNKHAFRQEGLTALMVASINGKIEVVVMLIEKGADVHKEDKVKYTIKFIVDIMITFFTIFILAERFHCTYVGIIKWLTRDC
jgi:polyribonucleotide nucleotidyltransferase